MTTLVIILASVLAYIFVIVVACALAGANGRYEDELKVLNKRKNLKESAT